ncbi:MAG: phosphatidylcholine/phosphatidylserine synthase [Simkaniaceae bacterium]|nr:phosphatidylcholine/phosphatidylserine synthase [Simkaniaceae bacterium]
MNPLKQVYLVPSVITAFGLACGLFAIFKLFMLAPDKGMYHALYYSTLLLILAAIADVLDGAVARIVKAESDFGVMFDSLSDAVTFGVAPSVLFLKSVLLEQGSWLSFFAVIGAMLYTISGVLRLARYNVEAMKMKGDEVAIQAGKKNFIGLPIPAAAGCAISLLLFLHAPKTAEWFTISDCHRTIILSSAMLLLGYMMVCKWKFLSLKRLRVRVSSISLLFSTVIIAIFVLYGLLYRFSLVLLVISWGYLLLGCILTTIRLIAGRRSKTLVDFEPESDELE